MHIEDVLKQHFTLAPDRVLDAVEPDSWRYSNPLREEATVVAVLPMLAVHRTFDDIRQKESTETEQVLPSERTDDRVRHDDEIPDHEELGFDTEFTYLSDRTQIDCTDCDGAGEHIVETCETCGGTEMMRCPFDRCHNGMIRADCSACHGRGYTMPSHTTDRVGL